jgi:hypothetical protein
LLPRSVGSPDERESEGEGEARSKMSDATSSENANLTDADVGKAIAEAPGWTRGRIRSLLALPDSLDFIYA